jgi:DNA repair exonuclease SbcCD ATPase subunit
MAKLPENEFSKSRNFRELDEALKLSFLNIKNDMAALKEGLHQQSAKVADFGKVVKDSKADLVTVDKFNILKIKIGELNESLKKLWDVEKRLEDLDNKAVLTSEFDKQSAGVDAELSELKKKVTELSKTASTEEQTKELAEDVSKEFDKVKQAIEELRSIKDTITRAELEKRTDVLNKRADDVRKDFDKVRLEVKDKVKVEQVESLVKDINAEFDRIKSQIADIKLGEKRFASSEELDKEIARLEKRMSEASDKMSVIVEGFTKGIEVTLKDFVIANEKRSQSLTEEIDKVNSRVSKEAGDLWKESKTFVTKKQAENLVLDINKEFDKLKSDLDKNSKALSQLAKQSATKEDSHSMFDDLRHRLDGTNAAMKDRFDDLVKRIKKESDSFGKGLGDAGNDLAEVEGHTKKEFKQVIYRGEFHKELDAIQDEFERLHHELKEMNSKMSESSELDALNRKVNKSVAAIRDDYVERKHFDRLVDVVSVLQDRVEMQKSLVKEKKRELKAYAKELKAAKKASKRLARYESQVEKVSSKKAKLEKRGNGNGKNFLANFLIGAAFVILIAAIGFFFAGFTGITDVLSIAAVVCFVLGIIIRIVVALKNGN